MPILSRAVLILLFAAAPALAGKPRLPKPPRDFRDTKAQTAYIEGLRAFLDKGGSPNELISGRGYKMTLLCQAAFIRNIEVMKLLLERGADAKQRNEDFDGGQGAINCAAYIAFSAEAVRLLIKHGAETTLVSELYGTPLDATVKAATPESPGIIDALLESGVDVNRGDHFGVTALHRAASADEPKRGLVQHLLLRGANPMAEARDGRTPIDYALDAYKHSSREIYKELADMMREAVKTPPVVRGDAGDGPRLRASSHAPRLTPAFASRNSESDYGIVIGIEQYADLPPSSGSERDAGAVREFYRALGIPERNIVELRGQRGTKTGFEKIFEAWLQNNARAGSRVFVYFSGHGAPDPKTGEAYLVPYDGDPQYLAQTGYPLKRLYQSLGRLKAKQVMVMLDSCFSGAGGRSVLAKGTRPLVGTIETAPPAAKAGGGEEKLIVMTASGPDQISGSDEGAGYGLFTRHLLEGLNGGAKDAHGRVTVASLYTYLKPRVQDDARRANREQTPQLMGAGADSAVLREK